MPHFLADGDQITLTGFTASGWNGTWSVLAPSTDLITITLLSNVGTASVIGSGQCVATFLSTYLPDLFLMASLIYISGYQRNFSATGNDPQMPVNYEQQYQTLLKGAMGEEARKGYEGAGWTSQPAATTATPSRG